MKISLVIVVENMLVKYNVNRLETILKNKSPKLIRNCTTPEEKSWFIWLLINVFTNTKTIGSFWMK